MAGIAGGAPALAAAAGDGGPAAPVDAGAARISQLKAEKARLLAERKRVQVELRSEEKKRQRRMKAARNLSNEDLVAVLGARAARVVGGISGDGVGAVAGGAVVAEVRALGASVA